MITEVSRAIELLSGTALRDKHGTSSKTLLKKSRALRRQVEEEQWDTEFARTIKGEPRQPVPGINSDNVPAAFSDKAGVHLEEDQADARLGQQDEGTDPLEPEKFRCHQTDLLPRYVQIH